MDDSKGRLLGAGWLLAKEMWFWGWESWVAIRITGRGKFRRELMIGAILRPSLTARDPFYSRLYSTEELAVSGVDMWWYAKRLNWWTEILLHINHYERWNEFSLFLCHFYEFYRI